MTTHSQGANTRVFCRQFIYKITVNESCYQLSLDYGILVLHEWVLSCSIGIRTLSSISFLSELNLLPLAFWLSVTESSLSTAGSPHCCLPVWISQRLNLKWIPLGYSFYSLDSFWTFCFLSLCLESLTGTFHLSLSFHLPAHVLILDSTTFPRLT